MRFDLYTIKSNKIKKGNSQEHNGSCQTYPSSIKQSLKQSAEISRTLRWAQFLEAKAMRQMRQQNLLRLLLDATHKFQPFWVYDIFLHFVAICDILLHNVTFYCIMLHTARSCFYKIKKLEITGTYRNNMEHYGTILNNMEQYGTIRKYQEHIVTICYNNVT